MAISRKLADLKLSESEKTEEKITTALGQLQRLGLTLTADVIHQVREQAQEQGLYNIDSIKQLAKEHLNKTDEIPKLPEIIAQDKPVSFSQDAAKKEKRTKDTNAGMHAFEIKEEEKNEHLPKDKEKAERLMKLRALVYAMRDEDSLGIKHVRYADADKPVKPKTAEEAYLAKEGDCDDLSRLYVALAQEQLGITSMSQFYVVFKNARTGEEQGHAALFYVDGAVLYIDPGFEKAHIIPTKSNSLEEAINDPEFRKELEQYQFEARGKKDKWKISEIKTIPGSQSVEAVYCFEIGNYFAKNENWESTATYMGAAIEGGMQNYAAYFTLGEANYRLKRYDDAIGALEAAKNINGNNGNCYTLLGLAYKSQGLYSDAAKAFREQAKLEPQDYDAKYNLGSACNEAGNQLMKLGEYKPALNFYKEAEKVLGSILDSSNEMDKKEINDTLDAIKQMKEEARKRLTK